jgi:hypothetical protein
VRSYNRDQSFQASEGLVRVISGDDRKTSTASSVTGSVALFEKIGEQGIEWCEVAHALRKKVQRTSSAARSLTMIARVTMRNHHLSLRCHHPYLVWWKTTEESIQESMHVVVRCVEGHDYSPSERRFIANAS